MLSHVNLDNPTGTRVVASDWATAINAAIDALNVATIPTSVAADAAFVATDAGGLFSNTTATNRTKSLIPGLGCVLLVQSSTGTLSVTQGTASALSGVTATTATQPALLMLEVSAGVYQGIAFAPNNLGSAATHAATDFAPAGAYVKPAGGIPSADLSSAVQSALTAAGTAIQSVKTINGKSLAGTGDAGLTAADVGALAASQLGAAGGAAQLGSDQKLLASQVPDLAIAQFLGTVASQAAMLALGGQRGDWCIRSDTGTNFVLNADTPSVLSSWTQLSYPAAPVSQVNGKTGIVSLSASDVGAYPLAVTTITASRALTLADAGATLVNNTSNAYALLLVPGLGRITLEQSSTGALSVTLGSATTLTGATFTTVFQSRLTLIEQSPGVYHGEYANSPLLPVQPDLATLNTNYPAASNVGRTVQVGTAAPYQTYRSNGVTWLGTRDFVDPFTTGALENYLDAISAGTSVVPVYLVPGATYIATRNVVADVYKVGCIIGSGTVIDGSAVTGWVGLTLDYKSSATGGTEIRKSKTRVYEGFELLGPGKTASGTAGIWVHGSVSKNAPEPSLRNLYVHEFETLIGGRDSFYLTDVSNCHFYNGTYGLWQQAGTDSGENCVMTGGLFDQCYCFIRLDDTSSEWTFNSVSFDYGRQLILVLNPASVTFNGCHIECRGKNLALDNNNYILDGSGVDTRAPFQAANPITDGFRCTVIPVSTQTNVPITITFSGSATTSIKTAALGNPSTVSGTPFDIVYSAANTCFIQQTTRAMGNIPCTSNLAGTNALTCDAIITRDCFVDADGDGTVIRFKSGSNFNVNNSGGSGPYSMRRYVKVRNIGTLVDFDGVYTEGNWNYADHFWDGPGRVICGFITRTNSSASNIIFHNRQSRYNLAGSTDLSVQVYDSLNRFGTGSTLGTVVTVPLKTVITGTNDLPIQRLDLHQNWWICKGRGGNQPSSRFNDSSNYDATRDAAQSGLSSTGNIGIQVVSQAVQFTASISTTNMTVTAVANGAITPGMTIVTGATANTKVSSQSSGVPGGPGVYVVDTSQTVASTSMVATGVGNAAATAWSISGEVLTVTTASGTTPFVRDMVLVGTGVTAGTRIIGPLDAASQAGLAGTYLIDTTHGTVSGSGTLYGLIHNAVQLSKYNTESSGYLSNAWANFAVPITPRRIAAAKLLMLLPSVGGLAGGTVNVTAKYVRLADGLDANGCPVIVERLQQTRFKTWTLSGMTKDIWQETVFDSWGGHADAPPAANGYMLEFDLSSNGTPGSILCARMRVDYR